MFSESYVPTKMDVLCAEPETPAIDKTEEFTAQHMNVPVPIVLLPDDAWTQHTLPEMKGRYVVVVTVPVDECVHPAQKPNGTPEQEGEAKDDEDVPEEKKEDGQETGEGESKEETAPEEEKKEEEKVDEPKEGEGGDEESKEETAPEEEKEEEVEEKEEKEIESLEKEEKKAEKETDGEMEEGEREVEAEMHELESADDAAGTTTTTTTTEPQETKEVEETTTSTTKDRVLITLDDVEAVKDSKLLTNAVRVYVVLTHTDLFGAQYPKLGDVRGSFPEYDGPGKPKNALEYIGAQFAARLKAGGVKECSVLDSALLDEGFVKNDTLPKLLEPVTRVVSERAAEEKRRRQAQPRRRLRPGEGISAPKSKESKRLRVTSGYVSEMGRRKTNEDAFLAIDAFDEEPFQSNDTLSYYGVYDGHGGSVVADLCSQHVHRSLIFHPAFPADPATFFTAGYADADKKMAVPDDKSGATAATLIVFGKMLYFANLGDSECILVSRAGRGAPYARTLLSQKHSVADPAEKKRIQSLGGMVVFNRLFGTLAVSRAFGDTEFKKPGKEYVSVEPNIVARPLTRHDLFAIVACDGLWDKVSYDDAMREAARLKEAGKSPDDIARHLCQLTLDRGSTDNVTIIVIFFNWS